MSENIVQATGPADELFDRTLRQVKMQLEEIMRRPKVTVRDAEEAAEAARALADLMRAEERTLRLLRATAGSSSVATSGTRSFAGLPLHEAAYIVLSRAGWPMHVRDLGVRIKIGGWLHPRSKNARPDQIEFQLAARLPRHPETFRKVAPNTFGLVEWGDSPPRTKRPKPQLGILSDGSIRLDGDELMDAYVADERSQWDSS